MSTPRDIVNRLHEESIRKSAEADTEKDLIASTAEEKKPRRKSRGSDSGTLVNNAQLDLFRFNKTGELSCLHFTRPESKAPRLLSRIPIFMVSARASQKLHLDCDNALPFTTGFGRGRRHGANLTILDETVFYSIIRLRSNSLKGAGNNMPIKIRQTEKAKLKAMGHDGKDDFTVHTTLCTVSDVIDEMGLTRSGNNHKRVLASIKRICTTQIELTHVGKDSLESGFMFKLIDVLWTKYEGDGVLFIQFSPLVSIFLKEEFVYLDLELRSKIKSDVAKAIFRFLSSQPYNYKINLTKLATVIGYLRPLNQFRRDAENTCKQLVELGWMESFTIEGKGRSKGYLLTISRNRDYLKDDASDEGLEGEDI